MAKKQKAVKDSSITMDNLLGFARVGARAAQAKENIPTGHFDLDFGIHYGTLPGKANLDEMADYDPSKPLGLPTGRVVEIYGPPTCGKSSLAYRVLGFAQQMGHQALLIDTEHSFMENLAELNGVDIDKLLYSDLFDPDDPDKNYCAEDVLDKVCEACVAGVKVIVIDSVANLVPKERMEKSANNIMVARLARCLADNFGKVAHYVAKYNSLLILINHIRKKVGVMFGNDEDSPGGFMLKHNLSVRIKMTLRSAADSLVFIEDKDGNPWLVGRRSGAIIEKNRMGRPLLDPATGKRITLEIPIYYEPYFPNINEIIFDMGRKLKIISVRKNVYTWGKIKVEGKTEFIDKITVKEEIPKLLDEIKKKAKENSVLLPPELIKVQLDKNQKKEIKINDESEDETNVT